MNTSRRKRGTRRGQTIILAIAILLLLLILGTTFVTMVMKNLQRVEQTGENEDALTLALAGLRYASEQFRTGSEGADWRPRNSEVLWRTTDKNGQYTVQRQLDPDYPWMNDGYVRVAMGAGPVGPGRTSAGGGRVLLRVRYIPSFRWANVTSEQNNRSDLFDPNSGMIQIESIGRPGEFDPNDPTFLNDPTTTGPTNQIRGRFRKVEAFVPIGLADQLWWITNKTNERGPAHMGVQPYRDGTGNLVEAPVLFQGGIRSNMDVQWHGKVMVRVYPARGEGVVIKGRSLLAQENHPNGQGGSQVAPAILMLDVVDDDNSPQPAAGVLAPENFDDKPNNDTRLNLGATPNPVPLGESGTPTFNPVTVQEPGGDARQLVIDDRYLRQDPNTLAAQSARFLGVPELQQHDPATGILRWRQLTQNSGATVQVTDGATQRIINTGWYGLTDRALLNPSFAAGQDLRARGLYIDNYGDLQWKGDRSKVKDDWMQRGRRGAARWNGWFADQYVPWVVRQDNVYGIADHEIAEMVFTDAPVNPAQPLGPKKPVIRVIRHDPDVRSLNLGAEKGRDRVFYRLIPDPNNASQSVLRSADRIREFDYPPNGVIYCEGSIRVRGVVGYNDAAENQLSTSNSPNKWVPRSLTLVSGGTIYVEGNLVRSNARWNLALMAQDYVTLNPTAFMRVNPGSNVPDPVSDTDSGANPVGTYHYTVPQSNGILDFSVAAAGGLSSIPSWLFHFRHSGEGDASSSTDISLLLPQPDGTAGGAGYNWDDPATWPRNPITNQLYDPQAYQGFPAPAPYSASGHPGFYLFRGINPGEKSLPNAHKWSESDRQSPALTTQPEYEQKTFFAPGGVGGVATTEAWFRLMVGGMNLPNAQAYLLSRVAALPMDRPLPIKIQATMYAYTGSWFIIPPNYFNENPADTRLRFLATGYREGLVPPIWKTSPENLREPIVNAVDPDSPPGYNPDNPNNQAMEAMHYPFFHQPLNIEIQVNGSITENVPADPSEVAAWTRSLWTMNLNGTVVNNQAIPIPAQRDNDPTEFPASDPDDLTTWGAAKRALYSPRITYRYDGMLRRLVRARIIRTGQEVIAWTGPVQPGITVPAGIPTLQAVINSAKANYDSYVESLPLFPKLPAGTIVYEGNPL